MPDGQNIYSVLRCRKAFPHNFSLSSQIVDNQYLFKFFNTKGFDFIKRNVKLLRIYCFTIYKIYI